MKVTKCMWMDLCREELLLLREEADKKNSELEGRCQELQSVIQQVSEDFQKVSYSLDCTFILFYKVTNTPYLFALFVFYKLFFLFKSQTMVSNLEKSLHDLQTEHGALKLQQQKVRT